MGNTVLQTLSKFACELSFDDLPSEVVSKANDCLFDFIGCYYGAISDEKLKKSMVGISNFNRTAESKIWGTDISCGQAEAALAMGTAGYYLEYDDGISVGGHWGSASIPATMVAVLSKGGNGKDILTAIVAAYEVATRISRMFSPRLLKNHIHFPCTMGAFAATTGYAKGLGIDEEILTGALSLSGLYPVGAYSTAITGATGKSLYSGWPNYQGINSVRLSALGLSGDADIMENKDGFANCFGLSPLGEEYTDEAKASLGEVYKFMEVYFKPYPCCRWLHAPIHALMQIMKANNLKAEDIQSIDIGCPEFAMMYDTREGFQSKVTCQYSVPYSVSAAAYFGRCSTDEYEEEARSDSGLHDFVKKVTMHVDEVLESEFPKKFGVNMTVTTTNGDVYTRFEGTPWGPTSPPTKDELAEKFKMLASKVLSDGEIDEWISLYKKGFETKGTFERAVQLLEIAK